jgi:hypothetical protein
MTPECRVCGNPEPSRLLICVEVAGLHRQTFVCKPGVSNGCWWTVRDRSTERIAALVPDTRPLARSVHVRPPAIPVESIEMAAWPWHHPGYLVSSAPSDTAVILHRERT